MVLYKMKNSLPIKDISQKTLPSNSVNNCIKIWKGNSLEKQQWSNSTKMKKDTIFLNKGCSSVLFIESCLLNENICKQLKMMYWKQIEKKNRNW